MAWRLKGLLVDMQLGLSGHLANCPIVGGTVPEQPISQIKKPSEKRTVDLVFIIMKLPTQFIISADRNLVQWQKNGKKGVDRRLPPACMRACSHGLHNTLLLKRAFGHAIGKAAPFMNCGSPKAATALMTNQYGQIGFAWNWFEFCQWSRLDDPIEVEPDQFPGSPVTGYKSLALGALNFQHVVPL